MYQYSAEEKLKELLIVKTKGRDILPNARTKPRSVIFVVESKDLESLDCLERTQRLAIRLVKRSNEI